MSIEPIYDCSVVAFGREVGQAPLEFFERGVRHYLSTVERRLRAGGVAVALHFARECDGGGAIRGRVSIGQGVASVFGETTNFGEIGHDNDAVLVRERALAGSSPPV